MKTVILCGGRGLRLFSGADSIPKPLVEIGSMPILWHIMKIYSHFGYNDFILCLGHNGKMIKDYFLNFEYLRNDIKLELKDGKKQVSFIHKENLDNWNITFVDTGLETNTGGRIKRVEKLIDEDNFFVTYGDGVANIDLNKLLKFHTERGKTATLTGIHPMSQFGIIEAKDGLALTFKEKPRLEGVINGGFFVFKRDVFRYLEGDLTVLEEKPLRKLTAERQLSVYEHSDFWKCMDNFKDVEFLNKMWCSGNAPWKVWR